MKDVCSYDTYVKEQIVNIFKNVKIDMSKLMSGCMAYEIIYNMSGVPKGLSPIDFDTLTLSSNDEYWIQYINSLHQRHLLYTQVIILHNPRYFREEKLKELLT